MATEEDLSTSRVARALCDSITERLQVDDQLDAVGISRAARTIATLARTLVEVDALDEPLLHSLDCLVEVLILRVGESVEGRRDSEVYHLGRALDATSAVRRRCRRGNVGNARGRLERASG
jgi:hypothetical protein